MRILLGNLGNFSKNHEVTALGHATQGGNFGNFGNLENNSNEVKITVLCYSTSGLCYEIEARDQKHADFLRRMNPNRDVYA
jgi:hypothetical protein